MRTVSIRFQICFGIHINGSILHRINLSSILFLIKLYRKFDVETHKVELFEKYLFYFNFDFIFVISLKFQFEIMYDINKIHRKRFFEQNVLSRKSRKIFDINFF